MIRQELLLVTFAGVLMLGCANENPEALEAEPTLSFAPGGRLYQVRSIRPEMDFLSDADLRGRDRAAFDQLLQRAEDEEERRFLTDLLAEGKHPGIAAVEGDSIAARLIAEMLTAREILLDRHRPGPENIR